MSINYSGILFDGLFDIELLRTKGTSKASLQPGLTCSCKKSILTTYLTSIGNLMVCTTSFSQILRYIRTIPDFTERIRRLEQMFRDQLIENMYSSSDCLSAKTTCLFETMQNQLEQVYFTTLYDKYLPFIGHRNDTDVAKTVTESIDELYELAEVAVLNLSGFRINCNNISDDIINDEIFKGRDISKLPLTNPLCAFKHTADTHIECIHLYVTPAMYRVNNWLDYYLDNYLRYHINPKNIMLIVDYKLMPNFKWTQLNIERFRKFKNSFESIHYLNSENVDFGECTDEIDIIKDGDLTTCYQDIVKGCAVRPVDGVDIDIDTNSNSSNNEIEISNNKELGHNVQQLLGDSNVVTK